LDFTIRGNFIYIHAPDEIVKKIPLNKKIKIKFEVDTDPPEGAEFEVKTLLVPIPFSVRLYTLLSLFAGKIHALLFRKWANRVKGRDYYDFIWYSSRNTPCHLEHLKERMIQTGDADKDQNLTGDEIKVKLCEHFKKINLEQAKKDVLPFVKDPQELDLWGYEFFINLVRSMEFI